MSAADAATALGIAGGVALLVAIAKAIWAAMPSSFQVALALVATALIVVIGRMTGEIPGRPVELILLVVTLTGSAVGLREVASLAADGRVNYLRSDSSQSR